MKNENFKFTPKEVTAEQYEDMLCVLPPIYIATIDGNKVTGGFAVSEACSSANNRPTFTTLFEDDGKYYQCESYMENVGFNYYDKEWTKGNVAHTVLPYMERNKA